MSVEPSQFRRLAVRTGLRLALALLIGAAFAAIFRREIIRALLPLFFWEITWLGDDFRILGIALQNVAGDSYIGVAAELARPLFGNGKMLSPGSDVSMSVNNSVPKHFCSCFNYLSASCSEQLSTLP